MLSVAGLLPLGMFMFVWALFRSLSCFPDRDPELKLLVIGVSPVLWWHIEEIHQGFNNWIVVLKFHIADDAWYGCPPWTGSGS